MDELVFRTEELSKEQIKSYYVPSGNDREIVDYLKSKTPVILVGSRGIGKTFLMRIAEEELLDSYDTQKVLPVFLTFRSASLLQTKNLLQFQTWMLAKICAVVSRALRLQGKIIGISNSLSRLTGEDYASLNKETKIEEISRKFEESYKNPNIEIDASSIPSIDDFLDIIEDLCDECDILRIVVFIDEAAHVLYVEQQRQFFTLFRELRSPYLTCNAAVYPGVTAYGSTFQPTHDAKIISVNRNVTETDYVKNMKEIVLRQITNSHERTVLSQNGGLFALLAYASSGNPRTLLKTVSLAPKMNSSAVNSVFREFYKTSIWSDHSNLVGNYSSYVTLIDWGRNFIEKTVLPEIKTKNDDYLVKDRPRSFYFWVDRNVPQVVKEALRILEYTGIIYENAAGIRATRDGIGTRYMVNIGCLLSLESSPAASGPNIVKRATVKRMTEFSENHPIFNKLLEQMPNFTELTNMTTLSEQLKKDISSLDLTEWQLITLYRLSITTIGDLLDTPESTLMKARYVAEKRARTIKNAAFAAVFEYLLG
jgi:hypothetical protein